MKDIRYTVTLHYATHLNKMASREIKSQEIIHQKTIHFSRAAVHKGPNKFIKNKATDVYECKT